MIEHHAIAIVGGGLGGLMAARVLHARGLTATVFENEPSRDSRVQGGMLDIHDHNGQPAIRAAGLWEQFQALIHPGGEAMRILDHTGAVLRDEADNGDRTRPEVDRGQLRDMLLDSLPDGTVQWGRKVIDVRSDDTMPGRHHLDLADGHSVTTDLLIGADGAWSRVRRLVSGAQPEYTGVSFVEADLRDAQRRHPSQAAAVGNGMLFAFRGETGFISHLETDGSLHAYLGVRVPESWIDTIDFTDVDGSKRAVLRHLDGWSESLRGLIAHADGHLVPRRIYALPVGHSWPRVPGVTLLGDAAHLMSPFAGEGANLAMLDGAQLAAAIADHPNDTERAMSTYEAELFPRSAAVAHQTAQNLEMLYRADSPQGLVDMFNQIDRQAAAMTE